MNKPSTHHASNIQIDQAAIFQRLHEEGEKANRKKA